MRKKIHNHWEWDDLGYAFVVKSRENTIDFFLYREYMGVKNVNEERVYLTDDEKLTTNYNEARPIARGLIDEIDQIKLEFLPSDRESHRFDDVEEFNKFKEAVVRMKDSIAFAIKKK